MDYEAYLQINGGVSNGLSVRPDLEYETYRINSDSHTDALRQAVGRATRLAYEHVSNPNLGCAEVKVLSLKDAEGKQIEQRALPIPFTHFENGTLSVRLNTLEKIIVKAILEK